MFVIIVLYAIAFYHNSNMSKNKYTDVRQYSAIQYNCILHTEMLSLDIYLLKWGEVVLQFAC